MIKDFSIFFSRVIIVQDFKAVTFNVLFVYKHAFSVVFYWMKRVHVSSQFNSLFIPYISTARPFSLVKGNIEVKVNKHEIWSALTQLSLRCLKYIKRIFNPVAVWHSYFLISWHAVILRKKSKIVGENFFQVCKCNLVDFIEISGNSCANTNIHWRRLNIRHSCSFEWY